MKIDINPKAELFRWGPIDGKLIYPDFFNVAFTQYQKTFYSWPDVLWLEYYPDKMIAIVDFANLRKSGRNNFNRFVLAGKNLKRYYGLWHNSVNLLLDLQKDITKDRLRNLTDRQLAKFYKNWVKAYVNFWKFGLLPEVANWGAEDILKKILEKIIQPKDFIFVFERLSAPENLSFYQKADLELLKLKKYEKRQALFESKLVNYQKNHFWLLNSYHHTKILDRKYFENELAGYSLKKAQAKIKELEFFSRRVKKEKDELARKYKITPVIKKIASRLSFCVWWQDLRKYYIFLANHYIDLFLAEFARRYGLSFNDLHFYNVYETLDLAEKGKKISAEEIKSRQNYLVVHYSQNSNSLKYVSGAPAKKIIAQFIPPAAKAANKKISEFKGLVVSRGKKVAAKVRIINSAADFKTMEKGEILVTPMTSPDYIVVIKKAAAIITDEGGMTSHAAIVSRELGIPCIVGTKIATKVLKDGDLVEVDTGKGTVKKI
ncbi:MAG: PEP-utilizing enzyme [Patescibacteria group bacterium]|jgi:phosphohistidine swiveling domain-containing protein